jgi:hypothetical protein
VTVTQAGTDEAKPEDGSLVEVRGQRWVVSDSPPGENSTLQSVEDGKYGDSLQIIWEVEPGRKVLPAGSLPEVTPFRWSAGACCSSTFRYWPIGTFWWRASWFRCGMRLTSVACERTFIRGARPMREDDKAEYVVITGWTAGVLRMR